jgi:hypothetical protein
MKMRDHDGEFVVDADRAARVQTALDYINERSMNGLFPVISETRVDPKFLLGRDDLSGTVDVQILGGDTIELIDYKDGMGVVTAEGNMQLEQYAYGVLAEFKLPVNGDYPYKMNHFEYQWMVSQSDYSCVVHRRQHQHLWKDHSK